MDFTCLTCGDEGFTNAFVYCVACLDFVVHRYCLGVIPKTFDEYVHWMCDDCSSKMQQKKPYKNHIRKALENGEIRLSDEKHAKEKRRSMLEPAMEAEPEFKKLRKECTSRDTPRQAKSFNESVLPKETEEKKSDEKNLSEQPGSGKNIKEDGATASSGFDNQGFEMPCQARGQHEFAKDPILVPYPDPEAPNEPQMNPIWRGCFEVLEPNQRRLEGFVAHLSSKACDKVCDVACQLQTVLQLEMVPRLDIWPKSFKPKATVDNIALYFFPSKMSVCEYDQLVQKMIDEDVALRAHVQNAELLLFPSTEFVLRDWRLQEKYYIWGVFRGKQHVHSNKDLVCENVKTESTLKGVESPGAKKGNDQDTVITLSNNGSSVAS